MSGRAAGGFFAEAGPALYRENPFRVTGLAIDATARDIRRRSEELQIKARLGAGQDSGSRLLPLDPPPDPAASQEAVQRLRDPVRRLEDELFWFWPASLGDGSRGGSRNGPPDEALAALARGEADEAERLWRGPAEGRAATIARHNLAVLDHARALDAAANAADGPGEAGLELWARALEGWRAVVADDEFWRLLESRARDVGDPRLGPGTAREMRAGLPAALLSISARLAVEASRDGGHDGAAGHVRIMHGSGFAETAVAAALRDAAGPGADRVRTLGEAALERAAADPSAAAAEAARTLDQVEPVLAGLDRILPADHPLVQGAKDEAAASVMRCVVLYVNETDDYGTAVGLLERALSTAATETTRARVEQNLETVRGNLVYATCWFCHTNAMDAAAAYEQKMYGDVNQEIVHAGYGGQQVRTTWKRVTVNVPRCAPCKAAQSSRNAKVWGGGCGSVILALAIAVLCISAGAGPVGFILILAGIVGLFVVIGVSPTHGLMKSEFVTLGSFPPIREQIEEGWAFGDKPPNAGG